MLRYVQKIRVPVQLALVGLEPAAGFLSLSPSAELHEGPETLLERLNAPGRMLPFHRSADNAFTLVSVDQIEWVVASTEVAPELLRPAHYITTREERVRVRTEGGITFEGILEMEMPHEFNRASDYLNADENFFPLASAQGTVILHKAHVLDVRVFEASPVPRAA